MREVFSNGEGGPEIFFQKLKGGPEFFPVWDQNFFAYEKGGPEKNGDWPSQTDAPLPLKKSMIAP